MNALEAEQLASLLEVDEVQTSTKLNGFHVRIRVGDQWAVVEIDEQQLELVRDQQKYVARRVFDAADDLKRAYGNAQRIDLARNDRLDRIGETDGASRGNVEPERTLTRFEAIVEEMKRST